MNSHPDLSNAALGTFFAIYAIVVLVAIAFGLFINWRIASKAGYSGALSLLMLVPLVNFVVLILFAFTEWPIERALKAATGGGSGYLPPTGGGSYIPPGGGGYVPPPALPPNL